MSQQVLIANLLKKYRRRGITAIDALKKAKCFRLAARIFELKMNGIKIERVIENGHARYFLA